MPTAATWASTARHTFPRSRGSGKSSTSGRATWATRCSTPRSAGSACTSATTGTFPGAGGRRGGRARGLAGARIVSNPSATSRGLSQSLWRLEQPASAVANEYFIGAINRVGIEPLGDNDFYGQSYFVDPRGHLIDGAASDTEDEVIVRDLDFDRLQ